MIAAGVNAKALQTFVVHANISSPMDRYGHLMPGSEAEGARLLDAYLSAQRERDDQAARTAGALLTGHGWHTIRANRLVMRHCATRPGMYFI
jgi:hypothetical protein